MYSYTLNYICAGTGSHANPETLHPVSHSHSSRIWLPWGLGEGRGNVGRRQNGVVEGSPMCGLGWSATIQRDPNPPPLASWPQSGLLGLGKNAGGGENEMMR